MKKIKEKNKNSKIFNIVGITVLAIQILLVYLPCLWGIAQSFKGRMEWLTDKIGFPTAPTLRNYEIFFRNFYIEILKNGVPTKVYFETMVFNSILFAGGTSFFQFIALILVSYVVYKYRKFRAAGIIFNVVLLSLNIQFAGSTAAQLKLYHALGVYDNMLAMWILSMHPLSFYFLVFYSAFLNIPEELYEAAEVDGANRIQLLLKIAMPLIKGVILLYFLNAFINAWNNNVTNLMWLPSYPFVGYGLYRFNLLTSPPEVAHNTVKLAAAFITATPMLVVLAVFGNKMMKGVSFAGGVKG